MDLEKIKEAQAREERRSASIARGDAQLIACGGRDADRALLLAAVPDLIAAVESNGESAERQGVALAEAHKMIADRDNEIARLKTLAREGWEIAQRIGLTATEAFATEKLKEIGGGS